MPPDTNPEMQFRNSQIKEMNKVKEERWKMNRSRQIFCDARAYKCITAFNKLCTHRSRTPEQWELKIMNMRNVEWGVNGVDILEELRENQLRFLVYLYRHELQSMKTYCPSLNTDCCYYARCDTLQKYERIVQKTLHDVLMRDPLGRCVDVFREGELREVLKHIRFDEKKCTIRPWGWDGFDKATPKEFQRSQETGKFPYQRWDLEISPGDYYR
jgi:hypothetical protein